MNPLDRLFHDKLTNHTVAPSAPAWANLNAGLAKKNNPVSWMRWAAIFIPVILAAGLTLLTWNEPERTIALQTPAPPVTNPTPQAPQPTVSVTQPVQKKKRSTDQGKKVTLREMPDGSVNIISPASHETITSTEPTIDVVPEAKPAPHKTVASAHRQPMVLVYTLEPIAAANATDEKKSPSSIQKVVAFAQNVKHSDPLSEFKIIKEELLAIDLRKKSGKKNQ
ncbi:MAG: hypothetical protein SH819_12570 [Cytophagales bacterium]|nr:hypothetical protein [Cytophagales bacterium]